MFEPFDFALGYRHFQFFLLPKHFFAIDPPFSTLVICMFAALISYDFLSFALIESPHRGDVATF